MTKTDTRDSARKEDDLVLTKQDVLEMIDGMILGAEKSNRFGKNIIAKQGYIIALEGFKVTTRILSDKFIQIFWSDILKFVSQLMLLNQAKKESGQNMPLNFLFKKVLDDVKKGNLNLDGSSTTI